MQRFPTSAVDHSSQKLQPYLKPTCSMETELLRDPIRSSRGRIHQLEQQILTAVLVAFLSFETTIVFNTTFKQSPTAREQAGCCYLWKVIAGVNISNYSVKATVIRTKEIRQAFPTPIKPAPKESWGSLFSYNLCGIFFLLSQS